MPPSRFRRPGSSDEINATVARVAPMVLALLGDGVPRSKASIVTALAEHHPKPDVVRTLMRLAVTGQLADTKGKFHLPEPSAPPAA